MSVDNPNLAILEHVAKRLDYLVDDVVFLGGCATGLLITDRAAPPIRMTKKDYYRLFSIQRLSAEISEITNAQSALTACPHIWPAVLQRSNCLSPTIL